MSQSPDVPAHFRLNTEPMSVLGSLRAARSNLLGIVPDLCLRQPMVSGKLAMVRFHFIMDPGANRRILKDNLDNYPKSDVTKNIVAPAIGNSLFVAEGADWRWQRRTAAPVFSHRNIAALAPIMSRAAEKASSRFARGGVMDAYTEMVAATLEVIAQVTFSRSTRLDSAQVHHAIGAYIDQIARVSLLDVVGLPTWMPRPSRMFGPNTLRMMRGIADGSIRARRAEGPKRVPDLLDLLMAGQDPKSDRRMTDAELRDNVLTYIVAGHETTALTLAWALYLLAFDQKVQDDMRDEARAVLDGRAAGYDDVAALPLANRVVQESLRLYPPAALVAKQAQGPDELGGREIRKDDTILMPFYALHRSRVWWEDPDAFRPDRFETPSHDRYAYLPFSDGPRVCIGSHFAMVEAVIILATLVSRFRFEMTEGLYPTPEIVITLRPKGGVPLRVTAV